MFLNPLPLERAENLYPGKNEAPFFPNTSQMIGIFIFVNAQLVAINSSIKRKN